MRSHSFSTLLLALTLAASALAVPAATGEQLQRREAKAETCYEKTFEQGEVSFLSIRSLDSMKLYREECVWVGLLLMCMIVWLALWTEHLLWGVDGLFVECLLLD